MTLRILNVTNSWLTYVYCFICLQVTRSSHHTWNLVSSGLAMIHVSHVCSWCRIDDSWQPTEELVVICLAETVASVLRRDLKRLLALAMLVFKSSKESQMSPWWLIRIPGGTACRIKVQEAWTYLTQKCANFQTGYVVAGDVTVFEVQSVRSCKLSGEYLWNKHFFHNIGRKKCWRITAGKMRISRA